MTRTLYTPWTICKGICIEFVHERGLFMNVLAPRIVVAGAGVGGLAASIDLACHGCRVLVVERFSSSGGKARAASVAGTPVDGGPTVLTMPWVFDELFEAAGASFRGEVALEPVAVLARHAWRDGTRLDLCADVSASTDAIAAAFGARE